MYNVARATKIGMVVLLSLGALGALVKEKKATILKIESIRLDGVSANSSFERAKRELDLDKYKLVQTDDTIELNATTNDCRPSYLRFKKRHSDNEFEVESMCGSRLATEVGEVSVGDNLEELLGVLPDAFLAEDSLGKFYLHQSAGMELEFVFARRFEVTQISFTRRNDIR